MGKIVLFSLNLIFLVAYKFFFGGDVEVKQNIPDKVASGEKFTIEITFTKGEREGFAKWQQDLPEGFIASAGETAGATFSFKRNTVKLIWMALPENESFTVSYEVQTDPSLSGTFDLNGKFSYIEENERKDISSAVKSIVVGEGAMLAQEPAKKKVEEKAPVKEKVKEPIATEVKEPIASATEEALKEVITKEKASSNMGDAIVTIDGVVTDNDGIKVQRSINVMAKGKYKVELTIDKQDFSSFGKVEEYVPEGYIASELESSDGMFSFNDNVMKILWMALPSEKTIKVSYSLKSQGDDLDSATVHGVFSFLKGEESIQLSMKGSRFPNTYMQEGQFASNKKEEDSPVKQEAVKNESLASKKEEMKKEITSVPSAETTVAYRVQIAAGKKEVKPAYFSKRHGISEGITTEYHKSWYKYTVGSYGIYKEARDKRNQIWAAKNKIDDAFVTAYNSGERISVQEALMISKQKWFK